jgi:inner membrane protein
METNQSPSSLNIFERLNKWIEESITVKLVSIGFLVLILLIPAEWIQDLIEERQLRADDVVQEVSSKWSGSQTLSGPILVIPYKVHEKIDRGKEGIEIREYVQKYFFLPEILDINGKVTPEVLHRGMFDVAVYASSLDIKSTFKRPDFAALNIPDDMVIWKDAYMIFSITDLRGISDNLVFNVGNSAKTTEPSSNLGVFVKKISRSGTYESMDDDQYAEFSASGVIARLNWNSAEDFNGNTDIKLNLKGSQRLNFVPSGKTTLVALNGAWNDPSFDGEFLPESRELSDSGFTANWKVLHYNRPFSQQWNTPEEKLTGSDFGVKLLVPVDQYQKSIRTSKYGQLIIILTFVALFLVEITRKIRIHPFQYILIGVALIIYYTLLLSLSEQIGYNLAYTIASVATVTLISMYSISFLRSKGLVALFTALLVIFYTFIFVIILQQDFSLLLGSIGLFLIVGALMYFSRGIKWYGDAEPRQSA